MTDSKTSSSRIVLEIVGALVFLVSLFIIFWIVWSSFFSASLLIALAITAAVVIAVELAIYKIIEYTPLPSKKPFFQLFPKYYWTLDSKLDEAGLQKVMSKFGFSLKKEGEDKLIFHRGSVLGDFSIKIAKVDVVFEKPLDSGSRINIEYGAFALFDTGDLWKFSLELRKKLTNS